MKIHVLIHSIAKKAVLCQKAEDTGPLRRVA